MSVIPFKHYPLDSDSSWSGPDNVTKASIDDLKIMCCYYEEPGDNKGDYKLPHHDVDNHHTNKAGVVAAGNAIMGARGGTSIPKDELAGVKKHLEKHYHEFGMKAPWESKAFRNSRQFLMKNGGSVKSVDVVGRTICGYYASFNTLDSDGDVFQPGCFSKTIVENKERIKHLLQHDIELPIGIPLVLIEDEKGLYFETYISDTQLGNETLELYKDGVYTEHSVGFEVIQQRPDLDEEFPLFIPPWNPMMEKPANIITEVKLWEGSTVTWGANEDTPFVGVKADTSLELVLKHLKARNTFREKNCEDVELYKSNNKIEMSYSEIEHELMSLKKLMSLEPEEESIPVDEEQEENLEMLEQLSQIKKLFTNGK